MVVLISTFVPHFYVKVRPPALLALFKLKDPTFLRGFISHHSAYILRGVQGAANVVYLVLAFVQRAENKALLHNN